VFAFFGDPSDCLSSPNEVEGRGGWLGDTSLGGFELGSHALDRSIKELVRWRASDGLRDDLAGVWWSCVSVGVKVSGAVVIWCSLGLNDVSRSKLLSNEGTSKLELLSGCWERERDRDRDRERVRMVSGSSSGSCSDDSWEEEKYEEEEVDSTAGAMIMVGPLMAWQGGVNVERKAGGWRGSTGRGGGSRPWFARGDEVG
jgi:hypothetical protein